MIFQSPWIGWLTLFCAGACGATASVLLKNATIFGPASRAQGMLLTLLALITYGFSFLLYGYSLKSMQVGVAYISMVAVAAILLLGYSWLRGDLMGIREILGVLVVLAGIWLIAGNRTT